MDLPCVHGSTLQALADIYLWKKTVLGDSWPALGKFKRKMVSKIGTFCHSLSKLFYNTHFFSLE